MNVVITNEAQKIDCLKKIAREKKINNNKFMSFQELKKKLFFDYEDNALEYIIKKYRVNLDIAKIYVENLYFLKDLDNAKIKFLKSLKRDLEEHNLLIKNKNFRNYIKNKKITVVTNTYLTKEEKLILSGLDYEVVKTKLENHEPEVYEAKDINEEVEFVVTKISSLIKNGVNINNIKLISNKSYNTYLEFYFNIFGIPLNIKSTNTFYSTKKAQDFLNNYDNYENISDISLDKTLIDIINKSAYVEDKSIRKSFIIRDMKNTNIKNPTYKNAVSITSLDNIYSKEDYVFLLGFNIKECPKIYKDDDYLSDYEKSLLNMDTSIDMNKYTKVSILANILNIPNLIITYKMYHETPCYPSPLLDELNCQKKQVQIDRKICYSRKYSNILYAKDLDELYKNNLDIPYKKYDNKFTNLDKYLLLEKLEDGFNLSYTTLETFNECGFKYYLSKILDLNVYEKNFKAIIGDITHHILEIGLDKNIDISREITEYIKGLDYDFKNKDLFYLEKLSKELAFVLNYLKEQETQSELNNYLYETKLSITKEVGNISVNFKGIIDKVMYTVLGNKEVIAVVDYKTGDKNISLDTLKYGLNIQLPIYLYLLKKSERFANSVIGGFYIERVLNSVFNIDRKKSLEELKKDNLKLRGYSNSNEKILSMLDKDYFSSKMIKGLKLKKDGTLSSSSLVLSEAEMDLLITEVDEIIDKTILSILNGEYFINPKIINNKDYSCAYCQFKDICFKSKNDEVKLGGEKDELDSGTTISD